MNLRLSFCFFFFSTIFFFSAGCPRAIFEFFNGTVRTAYNFVDSHVGNIGSSETCPCKSIVSMTNLFNVDRFRYGSSLFLFALLSEFHLGISRTLFRCVFKIRSIVENFHYDLQTESVRQSRHRRSGESKSKKITRQRIPKSILFSYR